MCLQIPEPNCNLEWLLPLFHCSCHAGTCARKCLRWLPAVPFKTAQGLESFLSNISITVCFPIRRALLRLVTRLVAHCLPGRESASWEAQPFPAQTDNLSWRCFSRKSKNYSFSRLVPSLIHHGGRWSLVCLQIGRGHPGRTWCWSQLFNFSSDARIIWITSRCQYLVLLFTPRPIRQVKLHFQRIPKNNSSCCC